MMNVSEYASDVGLTVEEILKLCKSLEIKVSKEEDMLSDDDIIMLDNEIANNSTESEEENEDEILEEETLDDIIEEEYHEEEKKPKKKKPVKKVENKSNFKEKRKEMYKHKEKLQSNLSTDDNIILYKEGMTVADLSSLLNVPATQIIKKLMSLGMMVNINASLDFDTAEIIVSDYDKVLKNE